MKKDIIEEFKKVKDKYLTKENKKNVNLSIVHIDPRFNQKSYSNKNSNLFLDLKSFTMEILPTLVINTTATVTLPWLIIPAFVVFCYQIDKIKKLEITDDEASVLWVIYKENINPIIIDENFTKYINNNRKKYGAHEISKDFVISLTDSLVNKNVLIKIHGLKNRYRVIEQLKVK